MPTRSGFHVGTIAGIPIRIHYSFLLVLPFIAYAFGRNFAEAARLAGVPPSRLSGSPWLWGLLVALGLFASVLLHELAHSLYAQAHGGRVRSITLLMIGGVSELIDPPRRPAQEALMALVGPVASVVIGIACLLAARATRGLGQFDLHFAFFYLGQLNVILGVFNLLPAFPMDGGRILRALLARRRGAVRSTHIAANVGKVFAVLFAAWGFLAANVFLMIIGFFVFIGAEGEQRAVLMRAVLGELKVAELMSPEPAGVSPTDTVYEVAERMIRQRRLSFLVIDGGRVRGIVGLEQVERVPPERRREVTAREVMAPEATIDAQSRAADALRLFAQGPAEILAVVEQERLVGTLSQRDVARAFQLEELAASQHPRRPIVSGHTAERQA